MTPQELEAILNGTHGDPFHVLGPHQTNDGWEVRAFIPQAMDAAVRAHGATHPMRKARSEGFFTVTLGHDPGNYTLDLDGMMEVLTALKAPLIIPMHFFGWATLERFLERAGKEWPVERSEVPTIVVSKTTLPASPKVLVLTGF